MLQPCWVARASPRRPILAVFFASLALLASGVFAVASPPPIARVPKGEQKLFLEVFINGEALQLVAQVIRKPDGRMSATRQELKQIGVQAPGAGKDDELVDFSTIPGLGLNYDAEKQKLNLSLAPEARAVRDYQADQPTGALPERKIELSQEFGVVLNYNAYATSGRAFTNSNSSYTAGSVTLDSRAFSPYGVLQQSAIAGATLGKTGILRLDSSFVFAHRETATQTTIGDAVSGGLSWTRPVRQGGFQISRQLSMRRDLVMGPLPSVSGSAAVPSTVDVYVDNIRIASQQVGSGPFRISNLPVPSESGNATVIVRDVTGKETVTSMPFFTSANLLAPGTLDFSVDAGFPRLNYALNSFDYSRRAFGMGSWRYGVKDWLTLEGHAEGTTRMANAGGGMVIGLGNFGLLSLAGAGSWHSGNTGALAYVGWQKSFSRFFIGASSQRTFGTYEDIASVTAPKTPSSVTNNIIDSGFFLRRSPQVPRALDRITLGIPLPEIRGSLAASFINIDRGNGDVSRMLGLSFSKTFAEKYHVFATAYSDLSKRREFGVSAGLSFTLGEDIHTTMTGSVSREHHSFGVEFTRPLGQKPEDYGWRLFDLEGTNPQRGGAITYRNQTARLDAGARQTNNSVTGFAELDGAIVATREGVFAANRVTDAFAIVNAGQPGIEVLHENRPVGKTGWTGKLLVPNLQSFQKSKLAINPESLAGDRLVSTTEAEVMPNFRGAATLSINNMSVLQTARVAVTEASGKAFSVGTRVQHVESGKTFTIGYGGIVYLPEVDEFNTLVIQQGMTECRVTFPKSARSGPTGKVGPLACSPG